MVSTWTDAWYHSRVSNIELQIPKTIGNGNRTTPEVAIVVIVHQLACAEVVSVSKYFPFPHKCIFENYILEWKYRY